MVLRALILDVDGTLAETETIHRSAFNVTFAENGLDWFWSHEDYRELLRVTGGKERMRRYAELRGLSSTDISNDRIAVLHRLKNECYGERVRRGDCRLRPGVESLIRTARERGLKLALCTTTSRTNVEALIESALGPEGLGLFEAIVCGEDVTAKKPAPDAYLRVIEILDVADAECLAFEDSENGLRSALAANQKTIVTPSLYTLQDSFEGAAEHLADLEHFDLATLASDAADPRG